MKKMMSICFFFVLLTAGSLWVDHSFSSRETLPDYEKTQDTQIEEMTESLSVLPAAKYYAVDENGKVVIYHCDQKQLYCETAIWTERLPAEVKDGIKQGLFLQTEEQLYEFLENYSS